MARYLWESNSGCSRCDAMEGYYEEEPTRPHPNCQCDITEQDVYDDECFSIALGGIYSEHPNDNNGMAVEGETFIMHLDYEIDCSNGAGESGMVDIDQDYNDWFSFGPGGSIDFSGSEPWDEAEDELKAKVWEIARDLCDCLDSSSLIS